MKNHPYAGTLPENILLEILKQNQRHWISGQAIARRLSLTRCAVWKKMAALKADGYDIESSPRKGYRLLEAPDRMLAGEIRHLLHTTVLGQREIYCHKVTDSTNIRAKALAAAGAAEGVLVVTEEQAQGRGRLDRPWFSSAGENICASLIIRPPLPPSEASRMSILAAVAAAEAIIEVTGLPAKIKWPNDIIIGSRKIGGILLEMAVEMDAVDYMIIGLGLNVNTPGECFPAEIRDRATSVFRETGRPFPRIKLLRRFLELLESNYDLIRRNGFAPVLARWKDLTEILGRRVSVGTINGNYSGTATYLDADGFLILRNDHGGEIRLFSGDITIL